MTPYTRLRLHLVTLVALCFFIAPGLHSQHAATPPDADAEYLNIVHEYRLNDDGSTVYRYSHLFKLLSSFAFSRAYGESFIVYNPQWQTLKVEKSLTTMAGGREEKSPFNAYNEVQPSFAHAIAPYSHLREMVVTHTGLERGCVVDFAYTVTTKAGMLPGLMGKVLFGQRSPIRKQTVVVDVPAGSPLTWLHANATLPDPVKSSENGRDVYTWVVNDIPLTAVESNQPPMDVCLPVLHFTTASLEQVVSHVTKDGASMYRLGAKAKAAVATLTKGAKNDREKTLALRSWIEKNVGRMAGHMELTGYRPMPAQETFDRNAGSDLDMAVLLAAFCKEADIKAEPVLFTSNGPAFHSGVSDQPFTPTVPTLMIANGAAVRVMEGKGQAYLLTPNAAQHGPHATPFSHAVYMTFESEPGKVRGFGADKNRAALETFSEWIIRDTLSVAGKTGINADGALGYEFAPDKFAAAVKKGFAAAGQGMKVTTSEPGLSATNPSRIEVDVVSKGKLSTVGGVAKFALPSFGRAADLGLAAPVAPRNTPVYMETPFREAHRMTLRLPKNVHLLATPEPRKITNAVGSVECVIKADKFDIEIVRRIELPAVVLPEQYEDLRALLAAWSDPAYQTLYLDIAGAGKK